MMFVSFQRHLQTIRQTQEQSPTTPQGKSGSNVPTTPPAASSPSHDSSTLHRQQKETVLLRRTVEEMELRIETQKQTLAARDESIKRLLEMLQAKGVGSKGVGPEEEQGRSFELERRLRKLEGILESKDREIFKLKEVGIDEGTTRSFHSLVIIIYS